MSRQWEAALQNALANPDVHVPPEATEKPKRRNKYNAVRCEWEGIRFDSKREMARYGELRLLELGNEIADLTLQPVFELPGGIKYKADFQYTEGGRVVVEDVKGGKATQTRVFLNKWKQVNELYPDIDWRLIE